MNKTDVNDVINSELTKANSFLSSYGLSVVYNSNYNFIGHNKNFMAIYKNGSVKKNGKISIAINFNTLKSTMTEYNVTDLLLQTKISIWHEIGHGIVEWIKGLRRKNTQCGTKFFSKHMLYDFKYITENEEECVEEFGAFMCDYRHYSELSDFLYRYNDELLKIQEQNGGGNKKYIRITKDTLFETISKSVKKYIITYERK